jgi:hypothetical protein
MSNSLKIVGAVAAGVALFGVLADLIRKRRAMHAAPAAVEEEEFPKRRFQRRNSVSAECGQTPELLDGMKRIVYEKTPEERAAIMTVIKSSLLFQGVSEEQLTEVVDSMYPRTFSPGDNVIVQGVFLAVFYIALLT